MILGLATFTMAGIVFSETPELNSVYRRLTLLFSLIISSLILSGLVYYLMRKGLLMWNRK
jgi:hypothetical protein